MTSLTHIAGDGSPQMVDVGAKPATLRIAMAKSRLKMAEETSRLVRSNQGPKGDVLLTAKIAAIQAAKKTSDLIPLCHPLPIDKIDVEGHWLDETTYEWTVTVRVTAKTGVEMEAMTAASIAALTMYDMCKAVDQNMEIVHVALWAKQGGRRGKFQRESAGEKE